MALARSGAWSPLAAVATSALAAVPDNVSDAPAAALSTASPTALRSLEVAGLVLGRRVLIIGATGGVGRMAIPLAGASGAVVTAFTRDPTATCEPLHRLGAHEVVERIEGDFEVILDGVGGTPFGSAIEHLAPGGLLVNLATPEDDETVTFRASRFDRSPGARLYTFDLFDELARRGGAGQDLARLGALAARGRLDAQIEFEASWREPAAALRALLERRIGGKAVLHVSSSPVRLADPRSDRAPDHARRKVSDLRRCRFAQ